MANTEHWPSVDSENYGAVAEVAIGLIHGLGYQNGESADSHGSPVNEELQSSLMDAMFRAPRLYELLERVESIATLLIVSNLDQNRI